MATWTSSFAAWWLLSGCLVPDSMVDAYLDRDGDGERAEAIGGSDCDDDNPRVGVGAFEVCGNRIDDDCDGEVDEDGVGAKTFYPDVDGDGWGARDASFEACVKPEDAAETTGDCDDQDRSVHPQAAEDCTDGIDNDCDGSTDEADNPTAWFPDVDGDGFGDDDAQPVPTCEPILGYVPRAGDCDDRHANAYPGAAEIPYDGIDNACDGGDDFDLDADGYPVDPAHADPPVTDPSYPPQGVQLDCDDRANDVNPGRPETWYDGVDADCDGWDDDDQDHDGYASAARGGTDCNDLDDRVNPGRDEVPYDGTDDDCDPTNDDDADGDGHDAVRAGGDDCDDDDPDVWASCLTCRDDDRDGAYVGCDAYVNRLADCDDTRPEAWNTCLTCQDVDGDGAYTGCNAYPTAPQDCNDANADVWVSCGSCRDLDGDGAYVGCDATQLHPLDCDDTLANAWSQCGGCTDEDGDGYGRGSCEPGEPVDCDDRWADVWVSCATCQDLDGDGAYAGCDAANENPSDCDDDDPEVGGHRHEILDDGIDQDCSGDDLRVEEAHGIFVTANGSDNSSCGTMANPCRTLAEGLIRAMADDKVVFVAEGTYRGGRTTVSLFGGFDDTTWSSLDRDHTTIVEPNLSQGTIFTLAGPTTQIDGVEMRDDYEELSAGIAVSVEAVFARLGGVTIDLGGIERVNCIAVISDATTLVLDSSTVSGCVGTNSTYGVLSWGSTVELQSSLLTLEDVETGTTRAVQAAGPVNSFDSTFLVGEHGVGILATCDPGRRMNVQSTMVRIGGGGAPAIASTNCDLDVSLSEIISEGSSFVQPLTVTRTQGPEVVVTVSTSVLRANSIDDANGISLSGASATLAHTTIVATGPRATGIRSDSPVTLLNTLVDAENLALATSDTLDLRGVFLSAPCVWDGGDNTCPVDSSEVADLCSETSCDRAESVVAATAVFDPAVGDGMGLASGSPGVDGGVTPMDVTLPDEDLAGNPRWVGAAPDIGAYERQTP